MAGQPPPKPLWLYQFEAMSYCWPFLVDFDHTWPSKARSSDSASVWSIETTSGSIASDSDVESNWTTQSVDGSNTSISDNESHWSNQSVTGSATPSPDVEANQSTSLTNQPLRGIASPLNPNMRVLIRGLRRSRQASMRERVLIREGINAMDESLGGMLEHVYDAYTEAQVLSTTQTLAGRVAPGVRVGRWS